MDAPGLANRDPLESADRDYLFHPSVETTKVIGKNNTHIPKNLLRSCFSDPLLGGFCAVNIAHMHSI